MTHDASTRLGRTGHSITSVAKPHPPGTKGTTMSSASAQGQGFGHDFARFGGPERGWLRIRLGDPETDDDGPRCRVDLDELVPEPERPIEVAGRAGDDAPFLRRRVPSRFLASLGFPSDPRLGNENSEALVISDDIYVLLVAESQFKAITKQEIPDTATTSEAILQLQVDSRKRVDELADKAFAAGALPANEPNDQGFLYGRSFRDLDGHHWDVFCLDSAALEQST